MPRHLLPVVLATLAAASLASCGPSGSTGGGGGGAGPGFPQPGLPGTPIGDPTTEQVPSSGGAVGSPDGILLVEVPPGAVAADVAFTVQEVTNLAPGGIGPAWKVGPERTTFPVPVLLTIFAGTTGRPIDELTVAWQDDQGYWHRAVPASVRRDPVARTLSVQTNHLSTWTLTTIPTARDFHGPFSVGTSVNGPFVAQGQATFTFAGEDDLATYYLLSGTLTLPSALGSTTCTPVAPDTADFPLRTNVAELWKSAPRSFDWGASGAWHVSCADGSNRLVTVAFDTVGVGFTGCTSFVTRPESAGMDAALGGMSWDCTARGSGQTSGSWDFASAACGTTCAPANPCKVGTVTCDTGAAVCTETGDALDGSSCGTDQVCSAGACVACTAGVACTPSNPCVAGATSCATGTSACVETTAPPTPIQDGLGCGVDQVCSAGSCVACAAGVACTPANPCHQGLTSCATGASICEDSGFPLTDGSTCGTDLVCYAGACIACTQDAPCTSASACTATATYECSTGVAVCTDRTSLPAGTTCGPGLVCSAQGTCDTCSQGASCSTANPCAPNGTVDCASGSPVCVAGAALPAGTSCGTGLVCSAAGQCLPCAEGSACTPANPCLAGTTSCSTGTPVCLETAALMGNGTACGVNQVCNAGVCVPCSQGASCTPSEACATEGAIQCGTGTPVCAPQAWRPPGASCGTDLYCNAAHACQTCLLGTACTPTDPCAETGTVQCSTGDPVCVLQTPRSPGTTCGVDLVCSPSAACIACAEGALCASTNPCAAEARLQCGSGVAACTDRTFQPDGTACAAGRTCNGGSCVTSRTVNGTRTASFWADGSTTSGNPANGATSLVSAVVPDGKGGWATYPGTMTASGSFSISNVPSGPYWLRFQEGSAAGPVGAPTYLDTASSTGIDLGYDQLGRSTAVPAASNTPVTFPLTGMPTGTNGYQSGDLIQFSCSNADVYDRLTRVGATGTTFQDNWLSSTAGVPLNLVAVNDTATIYHLKQATDTSGYGYFSARRKGERNNFAITNGTGTTQSFSFAMSANGLTNRTPASGSWNVLAFEALRAGMNLPATGGTPTHSIVVGATVGTLTAAGPVPRNAPPVLFSMTVAASPAQNPTLGTLTYARVLPARWLEWREVSFSGNVSYVTPVQALPAPGAVTATASAGKREAAPATSALAPALSPVQDLRVRATTGAESTAYGPVVGVGLTPTLTWLAPATGTATSYVVEVFRLGANGTGTTSTSTLVATFVTGSTSVSIPSGVLTDGSAHYVRVTARAIVSDPWSAPFRRVVVGAWAQTLSGTLTP